VRTSPDDGSRAGEVGGDERGVGRWEVTAGAVDRRPNRAGWQPGWSRPGQRPPMDLPSTYPPLEPAAALSATTKTPSNPPAADLDNALQWTCRLRCPCRSSSEVSLQQSWSEIAEIFAPGVQIRNAFLGICVFGSSWSRSCCRQCFHAKGMHFVLSTTM
jgi:hypothetical protein